MDFGMRQRILVMRHPETPANTEHFFSGRRDVPLTPRGEQQREHGVDALVAFAPERIWCSPLSRCRNLAEEAGERLGFLPGDMQNKVDPYLRPLYDALFEMLGTESYNKYLEKGNIEVAPLAYMRGRTQVEVAKEIGISQAQVSRLEKGALDRIKQQMKA